jgi:hypothetical protein
MTKAVYQSMFISLSALLMAALFVLQPTSSPEMDEFQSQVREQFASAAHELMAGESFAAPFALVWNSVDAFYSESADQAVALLDDRALASLVLMFDSDYLSDIEIAAGPMVARAPQEEALINIIPMSEAESLLDPYFREDLAYVQLNGGTVAGESIDASQPMEDEPPLVWMTITDSITEFPYCVAVFNGTINSYPGACASDDSNPIYEN